MLFLNSKIIHFRPVLENVPEGIFINFLRAEKSVKRWSPEDVNKIVAAEFQSENMETGIQLHLLEGAGHGVSSIRTLILLLYLHKWPEKESHSLKFNVLRFIQIILMVCLSYWPRLLVSMDLFTDDVSFKPDEVAILEKKLWIREDPFI